MTAAVHRKDDFRCGSFATEARGPRQVRLALISGHAVLEMARQLRDLFNCVNGTVQSWSVNRNLPPDLNDLIVGQAEEVADVNSDFFSLPNDQVVEIGRQISIYTP